MESSTDKKFLSLSLTKEKMRHSNDARVVKVRDYSEDFHNLYRTSPISLIGALLYFLYIGYTIKYVCLPT